jgi:hypothetical protein
MEIPKKPGVLMVRNARGETSRFSLARFVRDATARASSRQAAVADGRRLLRAARRTRLDVLTTDDIRHWIAERDPLVFAHRRTLRELRFDRRWQYEDPALGRIAALAASIAPTNGALLTELFLDAFVAGAGNVLFQQRGDDEDDEEKVTPRADVELRFGDIVDGIMPADADYSTFGSAGKVQVPDPTRPGQTFFLFIGGDETASRLAWPRPPGPVKCDTPFTVYLSYYRDAPGCAGVDFRAVVRGALLYAVEEGVRRCITSPCERALSRFLYASWGCGLDMAVASVRIEVVCLAS